MSVKFMFAKRAKAARSAHSLSVMATISSTRTRWLTQVNTQQVAHHSFQWGFQDNIDMGVQI